MKASLKFLSCLGLLISLQAQAQEERLIANIDINIQKEFVAVAPGDVETITGIVQQTEEEDTVEAADDITGE